MDSKVTPERRPPHPIVRSDYIARLAGMPPLMPVFYLVFQAIGRDTLLLWACLLGRGLVWPQVARGLAMHSEDSKRAEHRNLLLD